MKARRRCGGHGRPHEEKDQRLADEEHGHGLRARACEDELARRRGRAGNGVVEELRALGRLRRWQGAGSM